MYAGQSLLGNQTIVSKANNFELGFFTPGKSQNYYIGIWYKQTSVSNKTVVWVANRDKPLTDPSSSQFKLLENGHLVLLPSNSKIPIWSTNTTSKALNSSKIVLGDDGNLVLRDGSSSSSDPFDILLWQSFDHPTNVYLPGAKFGYNHHTKKGQKLTSWRNSEDPAQGVFSLETEPDGQYSVRWNQSQEYYNIGHWNGHAFSNLPGMELNNYINYSYTSNKDESFFTYFLHNNSIFSFVTLHLSGQLRSLLWVADAQEWNLFWCQPIRQCEVYGSCGAFAVCNENSHPVCQCLPGFEERSLKDWDLLDYSGGCARRTSLQCGKNDMFSKMPNIRLPIKMKSHDFAVDNVDECKLGCLRDCSCSAYAYNTNRCLLWNGDLLNIEQLDSGGDYFFIRIAASEVLNSSTKGRSIVWTIVVVVSGSITTIVALTLILSRIKSSGTPKPVLEGSLVPMNDQYAFLTSFTYKDLRIATKNFSEKLGGGGFGSVFKGTLPDSTTIAVKKLEGFSQGEKQFRNEVSTIGLIQHVNLVRLRGFCSNATKRMLVYDLMPNGSLDSHLFRRINGSQTLDWKRRYQIAVGAARGLAYLHEECRDRIIHCDIKPENILLDADFCPKVADFGMAKLLGREFSRVVTTMRGTIGYLAPEWSTGVAITAKADVYSYGMMLFEIISGRRNLKTCKDGRVWFFPTWAANKVAEGHEVVSILDNSLEGNADGEELTRAFRVACWCIQEDDVHRPSMGQIVQILEGLLEVNHPPVPKYLQDLVENEETINFFSE